MADVFDFFSMLSVYLRFNDFNKFLQKQTSVVYIWVEQYLTFSQTECHHISDRNALLEAETKSKVVIFFKKLLLYQFSTF